MKLVTKKVFWAGMASCMFGRAADCVESIIAGKSTRICSIDGV
ncbi:hypothetical protein ACFSSF_03030 [Dietzia aerolata]